MKNIIFVFVLFILTQTESRSQTNVGMRITPQDPVVGEVFDITIVVKNGEISDIKAPIFKNLRIVGGPNRSTQMQIINGKSSSEVSIGYSVVASSPGQYDLGPIEVVVNGKKVKIPARKINVVKNAASPTISGTDVTGSAFVKLVTEKSTYFVGEQITATLVLYHDVDVSGYSLESLPRPKGATLSLLEREISTNPRIQNIGSKRYSVHELKRMSIMPHKAGQLIIDPINIVVQKGESMGFFAPVERVNVSTKELILNIKNLPSPAKDGFTGAVGEYLVDVKYSDDKAEVGKGLDVFLSIRGNGEANAVILPKIESNSIYEVFGPVQINELSDETNQGIEHVKEIKYTLVPKKDTIIKFKPSFVHFDTKSSTYMEAISDSVDLKFIKSSGAKDIKSAITVSRVKSEKFNWNGALIGLVIGLLTFGALMFFAQKRNKKKSNSDNISTIQVIDSQKPDSHQDDYQQPNIKKIEVSDLSKYMPSEGNQSIDESVLVTAKPVETEVSDNTIPSVPKENTQAIEEQDYEKLLLGIAAKKFNISNPSLESLAENLTGQELELFNQLKFKIDACKFGGLPIEREDFINLLQKWERL